MLPKVLTENNATYVRKSQKTLFLKLRTKTYN